MFGRRCAGVKLRAWFHRFRRPLIHYSGVVLIGFVGFFGCIGCIGFVGFFGFIGFIGFIGLLKRPVK